MNITGNNEKTMDSKNITIPYKSTKSIRKDFF